MGLPTEDKYVLPIKTQFYNHIVHKAFVFITIILILALFLKSFIDIDGSWDTWNYHLPFAARIWNIVTAKYYTFENSIEYRYQGFPLFAEFLQGLLWFIFQRVQATNLVSFTSFMIYLYFLKKYLQVPVYLSAISLLAVPMVQIHATSSYIDLFTNICISIFIMMTYLLYTNQIFYNKQSILFIFLPAAFAANSKVQAIPIILLILCSILSKFISLNLYKLQKKQIKFRSAIIFIVAVVITIFIIFYIPLKNSFIYGNPAYPVSLEIAGISLNSKEGIPNELPSYLQNYSRVHRWLYSIMEINAFDTRRPYPWVIDQGYVPDGSKSFVMGGYFGIYVLFNVFLLGYIFYKKRSVKSNVAVVLFTVMSVITSVLPQSHVLRFYMYWIICLISLNLHLISTDNQVSDQKRIVNMSKLGLVSMLFLGIVVFLTKANYIYPRFYTIDARIRDVIDYNSLEKIHDNDQVCIVGKQPDTFLYASKFYKTSSYSVKAAKNSHECGLLKIIK